jgi:beta-glucosidase
MTRPMISRKKFLRQAGIAAAGLALRPVIGRAGAQWLTEDRLDRLVSSMTLDEKIDMLSGYNDFYIRPLPRLGIPELSMSDGPLGIASWGIHGRATAFPATIAASASWNRDLMKRAGKAYGQEWRSRGQHFMLAPGVNIYRSAKSGRNFEYFGEDPYLASEMVVPFIQSVQEEGVIATVKHFAANNQEFDRYTVSSEVDERTLMEIYLPAFKAAVQKAGVWACMAAYNPVNGVWNTQNKWLLGDVLKKQWGFRGMVMSDWGCTYSTVEAANAGLDLEMGSNDYFIKEKIKPAIAAGLISTDVIDDKVKRIYRPCIELGFFDRPQKRTDIPLYNVFANETAKDIAREGCVLLKNNNAFLPLDRSTGKTIAVIGPNAQPVLASDRFFHSGAFAFGGGGSSKVNPWVLESVLQGISDAAGKNGTVLYDEGISNRYVSQIYKTSVFETPDGKKGLRGAYFDKGDFLANSFSANPVLTRIDEQINFSFGDDGPRIPGLSGKNYAIAWTGFILPERTGEADVFVQGQGAYRLFLNNQLAIDRSGSQSVARDYKTIAFESGRKIAIRLEFIQKCSPAGIRLGYAYTPDWNGSEAVKIARMAEVVVFCGGLDSEIELEGTDRGFDLPYGQDQLIKALVKVNKNIVVTLLAGGGVKMSEWIDQVPAVLHAWYPGMEGGRVIGEILFGDVNPSGKLPVSIERQWEDSPAYGNYDEDRASGKVYYREGILVGYRHFDKKGITPLFPFGHGLSYTEFDYGDLAVQTPDPEKKHSLQVHFSVTNTGKRAGFETAQLYIRDVAASVLRPVKELKGFEKVWLNAGETRKVTLLLDASSLAFYDIKTKNWVVEPGEFEVLVGGSSRDIRLKASLVV